MIKKIYNNIIYIFYFIANVANINCKQYIDEYNDMKSIDYNKHLNH